MHEKTSAAAAPMNPKNGAISSPLKTAEEDMFPPFSFHNKNWKPQETLRNPKEATPEAMHLNKNPKLFQSTPKKYYNLPQQLKRSYR
jgi:hypothetical protein